MFVLVDVAVKVTLPVQVTLPEAFAVRSRVAVVVPTVTVAVELQPDEASFMVTV